MPNQNGGIRSVRRKLPGTGIRGGKNNKLCEPEFRPQSVNLQQYDVD